MMKAFKYPSPTKAEITSYIMKCPFFQKLLHLFIIGSSKSHVKNSYMVR